MLGKFLTKARAEIRYGIATVRAGDENYREALRILDDFEWDASFMPRVKLFEATCFQRLDEYEIATARYSDANDLVEGSDYPAGDKAYLAAYASYFGSICGRKLDPDAKIIGSIDLLKLLQPEASYFIRKNFYF